MQRVAPVTAVLTRSVHAAATATVVEAARSGVVAPGMRKAAAGEPSAGGKAEVFWMRDPKTGYWSPENRFGEVDPAELREILLSKK